MQHSNSNLKPVSEEDQRLLLKKVHGLIREQAWDEALEVSQGFRQTYDLGSIRLDLALLEASCWRRKGNHARARDLYTQLQRQLDPQDPRLADVLEGLAESFIITGDFQEAYQRTLAASQIPAVVEAPTSDLGFRVRNQLAHAMSYINMGESLKLYEQLCEEVAEMDGGNGVNTSAISNLYFQQGNVLFRNGDYADAIEKIEAALVMAVKADALKTVADCKRKLPLAHLLNGNKNYVLDGLVDLDYAQRTYSVLGDRAYYYSYTERGEILKVLRRYEEAQESYKKSLWGARDIDDEIRIAHSLLGLYELDRVFDLPVNDAQWQEAYKLYSEYGYTWGMIHCLIRKALAQDSEELRNAILQEAVDVIRGSTQASFKKEKELITALSEMPLEESKAQMPLLNWS